MNMQGRRGVAELQGFEGDWARALSAMREESAAEPSSAEETAAMMSFCSLRRVRGSGSRRGPGRQHTCHAVAAATQTVYV